MEKIVDGRKVIYSDILRTTHVFRFNFIQRLKLLFGYKLRVYTRQYIDRKTTVVHIEQSNDLLTTKKLVEQSMKKVNKPLTIKK